MSTELSILIDILFIASLIIGVFIIGGLILPSIIKNENLVKLFWNKLSLIIKISFVVLVIWSLPVLIIGTIIVTLIYTLIIVIGEFVQEV